MNNSVDSTSPRRGIRSRLHIGAAIAALAFVPLAGKSLTTVSDGLSVTTVAGSNVVYGGGAAGKNNTVSGWHAFAVGDGNNVAGYEGNFSSGMSNVVNSYASAAIGKNNSIMSGGPGDTTWHGERATRSRVLPSTAPREDFIILSTGITPWLRAP
ncbi:MAG: hypothetical protein EOP86_22775 [Verrucomicrobiaceae bacterium]|nr:MAG: hypothetical protein EOP86_22775 [Verrucomicrobiaceae bacterium]